MSNDQQARGGRHETSWVLLHGTPLTPAVWRDTATLLTDQPVLIPDCTRVPAADAQRTLAAQVAEEIGDRVVDVVGHSFGGQVALDLALMRPGQVRSLTLLCSRDTPFPAFAASAAELRAGSALQVESTLARWFTAAELRAGGAAVQQVRRELEQASVSDWAAALEAIAAYQRSDRSHELSMPVALYAAGGDAVSTPQAMAMLAQRIPGSRFTIRPEWMHMSPFVDPAALAELLRQARERR